MTIVGADGWRLPTAADEVRFWTLIESAWERLGPEPNSIRRALTVRTPDDDDMELYALDEWLDDFIESLAHLCEDLSDEEVLDLDRVLERKLYDIDRAAIQEVTDGSDDGFLYCRGFIVALGRAYYDAVNANPAMAIVDAECEDMCYFFAELRSDECADYPDTGSGISRESCSNPAGWPDLATGRNKRGVLVNFQPSPD